MAFSRLRYELIEDWKQAWKFASMRLNAIGLLLMTIAEFLGQSWQGMPSEVRGLIPHATTIALILFGIGLIARIIKKKDKDHGTDE